jgi:hypothetical protein
MDVFCNDEVALTGVIAETIYGIGKMSLCMRLGGKSFNRDEKVQFQALLDPYRESSSEFQGLSIVILSWSCSRRVLLNETSDSIITHGQLNLLEHKDGAKRRLNEEEYKKLQNMVEAARAFALAALLIN